MIGKIDIETLAALVACRARVDRTEPDPKNLRVGWRTDQLLGDIDAYVIGQENDPAAYAEIARVGGCCESPEIAALLQLAEFRGERLLPVIPAREQKLLQMVKDLEKAMVALPKGTRKMRCRSLFDYHRGVFYDAYGQFGKAADMQRLSAEAADIINDAPGAAVGRFVETVYRLKQALVVWETVGELEVLFSSLEARFVILDEAVCGTAMEVQWGQGNGPMHMIQACVWLNKLDHPNWDTWVATALAAAEKLGQAFKPGADFVRAADKHKRAEYGADAALQAVADDANQANEVRAAALLVLARRALACGQRVRVAEELIGQMPEQGAQHVRAIAERLLQQGV